MCIQYSNKTGSCSASVRDPRVRFIMPLEIRFNRLGNFFARTKFHHRIQYYIHILLLTHARARAQKQSIIQCGERRLKTKLLSLSVNNFLIEISLVDDGKKPYADLTWLIHINLYSNQISGNPVQVETLYQSSVL